MAQFPNQLIPESKKDEKWCKEHIYYADELYNSRARRLKEINRNYSKYNGLVQDKEIKYITDKYGNTSRAEFKTYKLGKTKIDLILGEWLLQPLSQTVATTNKSAISKKMKNALRIKAVMKVRKELDYLKNNLGVDVMNGMEIPKDDDPNLEEKINPKTKNELIMQSLLKDYVKREDLKEEYYKNVSDVAICGECFGKNEILVDGKVVYRRIDPRYAIFEELDGDTFRERSPIKGEVRPMSVHQIITNYYSDLKDKDRELLENLSKNPNSEAVLNSGFKYKKYNNAVEIDVTTVEWFSVRPEYIKISPNPKNEKDPYKKSLTPEYYEKNENKIKKDVKDKKYEIKKTYKTDLWEATRIGNSIFTRCRRKPYQFRNQNHIGDTKSSYTGLGFNSHTGSTISLQELLDEISFLYDVAWFQITRELNKNKGKVLIYDGGALPLRKSITDVMRNITKDGLLIVNSAADQNRGQRDIDINGIREVDLGLSQSFVTMVNLLDKLEQTADKITGLNENRQGNIAASSTATNAQSSIRASRTITEPMFYFVRKFIKRSMLLLAHDIKLSSIYIRQDEAENIIGTEDFSYLKMTEDFAFDDYGVYITDGGKESEIRQSLLQLSEAALNSKQLRFQDILKLQLSETLTEATEIIEKGFAEMEKLNQEQQLQLQQAQAQSQQAVGQQETERREDQQLHEKEMAILEAELKNGENVQQAKNELLMEQQKAQMNNSQQQQPKL